jgi:hypothetical protein
MKYIIISYKDFLVDPISTDFKLIAYMIAFLRSFYFEAVYIFDSETDELIYSNECRSLLQRHYYRELETRERKRSLG